MVEERDEVSESGIEQRLNEIDFHQEVNPEIVIPLQTNMLIKTFSRRI